MLKAGGKFGHYEVVSAIGAGGMGEIYRAVDTRLKRDVAIKVLPERLTKDSLAVERFMREAYSASALNHPNILTIYDIGKQDEIQFIATEFVEGNTLRTHIEEKSLDLQKALDVGVQISSALVAAHEANIVHRDIKPENIMVRRDGYVKVLDFGLAKLTEKRHGDGEMQGRGDEEFAEAFEAKTIPGMILGTANYMSPEQARGLDVDTRSDIFSLGVVIYEMVAGHVPFWGETISDVIAAILTSEPVSLSERENIPLELEWSISKALCKDCEERYQTIKGLLGDLKRLKQRLEFETELKRVSGSKENKSLSDFVGVKQNFGEQATAIFSKDAVGEETRPTAVKQISDRIESLAILPLVNGSNDANTEYLSDGITESIINCLSSIPELRVVPRSTVFRYKDRDESPQEIGNELGVCAVFAGRVIQLEDTLIVKTELIDVARQSQIWGEQYRRKMTDIFELQEAIAQDISDELKLKIAENEKLINYYTENIDAYHFYLKGRYFVTSKRTGEWIKKGIEFFQKAIDLDPNYALAYSGLAEAYGFFASSTGGWKPNQAYPKAEAAAIKALELDETLGEAHCSLGFFHLLYDWNFAEAETQFKRAIELSPDHPNAHDGYGFYLKAMGRHEEAIEQCKIVQQLDPLSPFSHISLGYSYYFARDFDKAIEECQKALEMDKHSTFAYRNLGLAYLQTGEIENAISALSKAVTFSSGGLAFEAYLGFAYGSAGKTEEALEVLENLQDISKDRYVPAYYFAMIHLGLGRLGETFEWLEISFEERSGFMPFLNVEPIVDGLRSDERFQNLIKRVGLPN